MLEQRADGLRCEDLPGADERLDELVEEGGKEGSGDENQQ
jgi:hypothetical protein